MAGTGTTSIRSYNFFLDTTITLVAYDAPNPTQFLNAGDNVPFLSHTIMFSNDGAADIYFSFDGVNDHGRVRAGESLQQDFRRERRIWLRRGAANVPVRFWAW